MSKLVKREIFFLPERDWHPELFGPQLRLRSVILEIEFSHFSYRSPDNGLDFFVQP
jgi:hypothetical protein